MKTIAFEIEKAKIIEDAVCAEFGCCINDVVCFKDTFFKKVVVFLVTKVHSYNKRCVGNNYNMSYLYVPAVVEQMEWQLKNVIVFKDAIENIYKKLGYE